MDGAWPWLASLPHVSDTPPPHSLHLAASPDGVSVVLEADVGTAGADTEPLVAFFLAIHGVNGLTRTLWTSDRFLVSSPRELQLRLLGQLLDEVIALSPFVPILTTNLGEKLEAEVVAGVMEVAGTDAAAFFSLVLLLRLFWICALDAPTDVGFMFFRVLGLEAERVLVGGHPALAVFLRSVGPDIEERFMRSLGYMLAKWCLLREIQVESAKPAQREVLQSLPTACLSYAVEVHGLWVLRGYAPVLAMSRVAAASSSVTALPHEPPEEPALRYGLAHQQLEAVAQLEYAVSARDTRYIRVGVRVDNIRLRVVRLGFRKENTDADADEVIMESERYFPSRVRLWVGPQPGACYATGPSLGRSTGNPEREVETARTIKGAFSKGNANGGGAARVKAKMRMSSRERNHSWRWEQEAEGSAGVFEGLLCDPVTGAEVSAWRQAGRGGDPRSGMRRRYGGAGRAFSKMRGLVVAGDELAEEVAWRVGREIEGRRARWRVGLKVWVSYVPNEVRSGHFETRCVEWAGEVELPLVAAAAESST